MAAILKIYFAILFNLKASWLETWQEVSRQIADQNGSNRKSMMAAFLKNIFYASSPES